MSHFTLEAVDMVHALDKFFYRVRFSRKKMTHLYGT